MRHLEVTDELQEQAALYALGAMDPHEEAVFSRHLEEGCQLCRREVQAFRETTAQLAFLSEATPPAELRDKVIAQAQPLPPGVHGLRSIESEWKAAPFPGVDFKVLYQHPLTHETTQLVRLKPGARYPKHVHKADEQCYVIEGDVRFGDLAFFAGDFTWAEAHSQHGVVSSKNGCTLLIVASPENQILGFS